MCVSNGMPLGGAAFLPVDAINSVQTLKAGTTSLRRPLNHTPFVFTNAGGGYKTPHSNAVIASTCDFDIVASMTVEEFQQTYGVLPRCCCCCYPPRGQLALLLLPT
jgi:hypothetical protein